MNGILLVDKPSDWTSNDVVCKLKGILHERRIGHSGTLDPMATGLLVVFIGRATRAVQFAENDTKRYLASIRLGLVTDTLDTTGTVISRNEAQVSDNDFTSCISSFRGEISQVPPMYSAIKIDGKRLYDLARKGQQIERKPRIVTISDISYCGLDANNDRIIDIICSKGTYIRSLCDDIGSQLGCGACMSSLRRIQCGIFNIEDALKLDCLIHSTSEDIERNWLLPVDSLFMNYPAIVISPEQEKHFRCGSSVPCDSVNGLFRIYSESYCFLAFGQCTNHILYAIKSFFEVNS